MRSLRGRERRLVRPGQLVAWDPSQPHAGGAVDGRPWASRLMVVEVADLAALADDPERDPLADVVFPEPVSPTERSPSHSSACTPPWTPRASARTRRAARGMAARADRALLGGAACPLAPLPARRPGAATRVRLPRRPPERNVGLDELAAAAGIGKFRLIRLFRERTGLPPHALQIAHRIRTARRLLEAGEPIADTAFATGFADQSHMHRHFQRSLGLTPARYQQRFRP